MATSVVFIHDLLTTIRKKETFSRNSKANASELLENIEDLFSRCEMHSDAQTTIYNTQWCATRYVRVST